MSLQVFIQFASKQSENDDMNSKDDTLDDGNETISMEPIKEKKNVEDTPPVKVIDPTKVQYELPPNEPHEFVNPMLFSEKQGGSQTPADRRREFFSSMIAAAEASSPINSSSNIEEGGVELINVQQRPERRNTIENIIDSLDV